MSIATHLNANGHEATICDETFAKNGDSSDEQFFKVLANTLKSMSGRGFMHFVRSGFYTAYSLAKTFTIFFHPKIRKNYGLYFTK